MSSNPKYRCAECHSTSVQIVVWYDPNADKVDEAFADDCTEPDMGPFSVTWCGGCSEHTRLEAVRCEHSACSQNYIDTGNAECIKGADPQGIAFTLEDAGPAHDTSKRRGARTIYVDGPNGKGDNGSHIEVFGPDRDAIASLLLIMFGAEEVKPETEAERLERFKRDILGAHGIKGGDDG